MTTIYLIRHAEAEGNLYRIAQGQYDSGLTARGRRQVRALERRFRDIPIDAVYSSDLYRAKATAAALFRPKGLPLRTKEGLREIMVGDWEQRTWGDIARRWPEMLENFSHHMDRWHIDGAETPAQVLERVRAAVLEIAAAHDGERVAVFSHGYAIRLLLANLQGLTLEETGATSHGDNTSVSLLEAENGYLRLLYRDDNSHLKTPEYLAEEGSAVRANALEPGLWFEPAHLPEQEEVCCALGEDAWRGGHESGVFSRDRLLEEIPRHTTLLAHQGEAAAGLVQLGPEPGWITLVCLRRELRGRGLGQQLIGQALQDARRRGADFLRAAVPAERRFLSSWGFVPEYTLPDGRSVMALDIRLSPLF